MLNHALFWVGGLWVRAAYFGKLLILIDGDVVSADGYSPPILHGARDREFIAIAAFLFNTHIWETFRQRRSKAELWNFEGRQLIRP